MIKVKSKYFFPPQRDEGESEEDYELRYLQSYRKQTRDERRHYDETGAPFPARSGSDRQASYEFHQKNTGRKRPGWWLDAEVIEGIRNRLQWGHVGLQDRLNATLKEMLAIATVVDSLVEKIGGDRDAAVAQVLAKLQNIEVEPVPKPMEEELERRRLEMMKSAPPVVQKLFLKHRPQ